MLNSKTQYCFDFFESRQLGAWAAAQGTPLKLTPKEIAEPAHFDQYPGNPPGTLGRPRPR